MRCARELVSCVSDVHFFFFVRWKMATLRKRLRAGHSFPDDIHWYDDVYYGFARPYFKSKSSIMLEGSKPSTVRLEWVGMDLIANSREHFAKCCEHFVCIIFIHVTVMFSQGWFKFFCDEQIFTMCSTPSNSIRRSRSHVRYSASPS